MLKGLCLLLVVMLAHGQYNETFGKILGRLISPPTASHILSSRGPASHADDIQT
jgi:hypothetical protein